MFYHIFLISFMFIILVNIRRINGSLLSRFRNPNEYVPRDFSKYFFPEDLDDNMYAELLEEVPELEGKMRYNQYDMEEEDDTMLPFIRKEVNGSFELIPSHKEFDTEKDEYQEEDPGQLEYVTVTQGQKKNTSTRRLPFLTRWPLNSSDEWAKRQNMTPERFFGNAFEKWLSRLKHTWKANCYWCGMNQTGLPSNSLCHDAFESPDWRARTLARYFRADCYDAHFHYSHIRRYKSFATYYYRDHGLLRQKYGPFMGGCFKRFLDVGKIYTQRGCRSWWPMYATKPNFVTHRFTRLEALIRYKENYCIVSPHASLTPFSRAISLYVRYHVCVCTGKYCNKTIKIQYSLTLITSILLILNLMSF